MATRRAAKAGPAESAPPVVPSPALTRSRATTRQQTTAPPVEEMPPPPVKPVIAYPRRNARRPTNRVSVGSVSSYYTQANGTELYEATPRVRRFSPTPQRTGTPGRRSRLSAVRDVASVTSILTDNTPAMREARSGLVKSFFPRLAAATKDLQTHLEQHGSIDDDVWDAQVEFFRHAFESYRQHYADAGQPYINGQEVLTSIHCPENSPAWQRAMRIISDANLTALYDGWLTSSHDERLDELKGVDEAFPARFFPDASLNGDDYAFEQALEIRTQVFALTIDKFGRGNDPLALLANVFCDQSADPEDPKLALETGPFKSLAGVDLNDDENEGFRGRYRTRIESLRSLLSPEAHAQNLAQLQEHFPFDDFWLNLKEWIGVFHEILQSSASQEERSQRSASQRSVVQAAEPLDPALIMDSQEEVDSQLESQNSSELASQPIVRAGSAAAAPTLPFNYNSVKYLRGRELGLDQQEPPSEAGSVPSDYPSFTNEAIIRRSQQLLGQQPPQSSAAQTAVPAGPSSSAAPPSGQKRFFDQSQPAQDDPFESDDAFESDARVPDSQRQGPMPPPASLPNKRVRIAAAAAAADEESEYDEGPLVPASSGPLAQRAKPQPSSSSHPAAPGSSATAIGPDDFDLEALSQQARAVSAVSRRKASGPQTRTPWSRRDQQLLIRAVDSYACKWSKIQKDIDDGRLVFDHPRDQQGLRDKARLLKQDILKTDALLPPSFDLVVLGKKEREAVKAVGKNPDRKEIDVDDHGTPINTEYQDQDGMYDVQY